MVKFSDLFWLINHCTDWERTGVTSFGRQLIFIMSSITNNLVILTIDGIKSFLQLMGVQNIRKNMRFMQTRVTGKSNTLFKMAESL